MPDEKRQTINEEAGLPDNWVPLDSPTIIPSNIQKQNPDNSSSSSAPLVGSLPPTYQLDADFVRNAYRGQSVPNLSLMPLSIQGNPSTNAGIVSTSTKIVTQAIAAIPTAPPAAVAAAVTDGLTHGDAVWETDSAYVVMRDDFVPFSSTTIGPNLSSNPIGEMGWILATGNATNFTQTGGGPPYIGTIAWDNNSTAKAFASLILNSGLTPGGFTALQFQRNSFALLENPGWKMTWIFKHDGSASSVGDFQTAQKSFYIGFSGAPVLNLTTASVSPRPDTFIGIRYDTSTVPAGMSISNSQTGGIYFGTFTLGGANAYAGMNVTISGFQTAANNGTFAITASTAGQLTTSNGASTNQTPTVQATAVLASLPLTAAANASGGNTVYTMIDVNSSGGGTNGAYIGLTFVVTGFVTGANNGTFTCVQSTNTQLTLNNASGAAETHTGFATTTSLNDSFYTFEVVQNPQYTTAARHNKQGQTFVTSVAPTMGTWHRLDMTCSAAGVVVMTLDGSATNTFTVTVPTLTYTSVAGQASCTRHEGSVRFDTIGTSGTALTPPFASGTVITVSGLAGGNSALNGTWTVFSTEGSSAGLRWDAPAVSDIGNNSTGYTVVGYPALTPFYSYGNDDAASPVTSTMRTVIDYFSLIWNPNLGPNAPGTPDPTKARYW